MLTASRLIDCPFACYALDKMDMGWLIIITNITMNPEVEVLIRPFEICGEYQDSNTGSKHPWTNINIFKTVR